MLLKREYVQKEPQEYQVDNELNVRREILAIFNSKRRDFPNIEDYDNYLEKIEEIVFTLVDSESSVEQKSAVRQFVDSEKMRNSQRIANANAFNAEQV
jgi:CDK-activating kinase assembly factor MAT1